MKIADLITPDLVFAALEATDKAGILRELSERLAAASGQVGAEAIHRVLSEREQQASTAVGDGVAIPHGKLDVVTRLVACVARAPRGVSFDSIDGKPTFLFFVLVWPENSTGLHLKALARISRVFKDPEFRTRLLDAPSAAEMFRIIVDKDASC
jgi:PTS system nitrogen regulatory IIA component